MNTELAHTTAALAWEMAIGLQPVQVVLDRYGIDTVRFVKEIGTSKEFKEQFRSAKEEWQSTKNARERVSVKAAYYLEDLLPVLHDIVSNTETADGVRLAALKDLRDLARMNDTRDGGEAKGGAVFNLVFQYPQGAAEKVVVGGRTLEHEGDGNGEVSGPSGD